MWDHRSRVNAHAGHEALTLHSPVAHSSSPCWRGTSVKAAWCGRVGAILLPSHRQAYHCDSVGWHAVMASDTGWQDEEIVGFLGPISFYPLAVPAYETPSYVWGTLLATCNIVCEGECIGITESLDFVLRRLRQTRRSEH
jgi:hypothetical protein